MNIFEGKPLMAILVLVALVVIYYVWKWYSAGTATTAAAKPESFLGIHFAHHDKKPESMGPSRITEYKLSEVAAGY